MMEKILITDFIATEEELEKSEILSKILANDLNQNARYYTPVKIITSSNSESYINELYIEGYIEKPNLHREQLKLTKEGIKLCAEGGYYTMVYNKYEKKKKEAELQSLNLKIKQKQLEHLEQKTLPIKTIPYKVLTKKEFENLIGNSESSVLDFKRSMYDFTDDTDLKSTAKFVKDVISFTNTVRAETAYIIIGVSVNDKGEKELVGLDKNIDDATLQAKVKDKVYPIPHFSYYIFQSNNKTFGILEFPVTKYETPVASTINMKGLKAGMPYHRMSSMNAEAIGTMVIHINDWLKSLPKNVTQTTKGEIFAEQIALLLKRATSDKPKLSELVTDIFAVAKKYRLNDLIEFCSFELKGITQKDINSPRFDYRIQSVVFCTGKATLTPILWMDITPNAIIQDLRDSENYYEYKMLFYFPITEIESYISDSENDKVARLINKRMKDLYPKWDLKNNNEITIFLFNDTFVQLYKKIRQKIIEHLVSI